MSAPTPVGTARSSDAVAASVAALRDRLLVVAPRLLAGPPESAALAADAGVGGILSALADAVADDPTDARIWLLATAVAGGYPTPDEMLSVRRGLRLATVGARGGAVLAGVAVTASGVRSDTVRAELVEGVVADVDFCAKQAHNTGIQRVVRNTVPHWVAAHPELTLVAWSPDGTGYRRLTDGQRALVVDWRSGAASQPADTNGDPLLIPVDGTVLFPEVPAADHLPRMTGIAHSSGSRTGLIGYDAIPIVSADTMLDEESDRFAHYVAVIKHSTVVSGISETTAEEFRALGRSLVAQGLTGPQVLALPLPAARPSGMAAPAGSSAPAPTRPLVLMVGSIEPRKNQLGVLSAARILWERGHDFELLFIGGGSAWFLGGFERDIRELQKAGHPVSIGRGLTDDQLAAAYARARVFAFPSLQEGYGLPVAEALAAGVPVVTTKYGSTAEIAADGGCLLIDPRDDDDIANAIEGVLTDDSLHARLVSEALARTAATWPEYAAALWTQLVGKVGER